MKKGISCHQRYSIPWSDIRKVNIDKFKTYNTYIINNVDYQKSRDERINFLLKCGVSEKVLNENIPKEYNFIPDFIWLGEKAHSCYMGKDAYNNMIKGSKYIDNKELVIVANATHTDLYDQKDKIPFDRIEKFIRKNM